MRTRPKRARLNMRIPADLLAWAKTFVQAKNTNLTQLFIDHLTDIRDQNNGTNGEKRVEPRRAASPRV